jgi:hypothetical protein
VDALDDISFDRLINIQSYSDAELKALADQLSDEEREVSKRRRLLHGEIDIVRAEMVRRLRGKHEAGEGLFHDGDIDVLTSILSGGAGQVQPETATAPAERHEGEHSAHAHAAREHSSHDLMGSVVDERLVRYISKQLSEGRRLDDILADSYVMSLADEQKRAKLLQNPQLLKALQAKLKQEFADLDSLTRPKTDKHSSE